MREGCGFIAVRVQCQAYRSRFALESSYLCAQICEKSIPPRGLFVVVPGEAPKVLTKLNTNSQGHLSEKLKIWPGHSTCNRLSLLIVAQCSRRAVFLEKGTGLGGARKRIIKAREGKSQVSSEIGKAPGRWPRRS